MRGKERPGGLEVKKTVMRTPVECHLRWVRYAKFHPDEIYFAPVE